MNDKLTYWPLQMKPALVTYFKHCNILWSVGLHYINV